MHCLGSRLLWLERPKPCTMQRTYPRTCGRTCRTCSRACARTCERACPWASKRERTCERACERAGERGARASEHACAQARICERAHKRRDVAYRGAHPARSLLRGGFGKIRPAGWAWNRASAQVRYASARAHVRPHARALAHPLTSLARTHARTHAHSLTRALTRALARSPVRFLTFTRVVRYVAGSSCFTFTQLLDLANVCTWTMSWLLKSCCAMDQHGFFGDVLIFQGCTSPHVYNCFMFTYHPFQDCGSQQKPCS